MTSTTMPEFTSLGCFGIRGRSCYTVINPGGYPEPGKLVGETVLIDGTCFKVVGVESYRIALPYPDSLDFALLVDPA